MAIPESLVDRIREQTDIAELIGEFIPLRKKGSDFDALCPFHNEKTPSFKVSPSKQIFHCFGCGLGGNVFSFLMHHEKMSFVEAVRFLADRLRIEIPAFSAGKGELDREKLYDANSFALKYFRWVLESDSGAKARGYLESRKISQEMIGEFALGYAPDQWDSFFSAAREKGWSPKYLQAAGLIKAKTDGGFYDSFRNRLMFPISNVVGKVIGFGGRTLGDDPAKYINSSGSAVFEKGQQLYGLRQSRNGIRSAGHVIVVEGYIDLIRLYSEGLENVVAPLGTALTSAQAKLLSRYTNEVVLLFDSDEAGRKAAKRALGECMTGALDTRVALLPPGKDPDEFLVEEGIEAMRALINASPDGIDFVVAEAKEAGRFDSPSRRAEALREILEIVTRASDPLVRDGHFRKLSERTGIEEKVIRQEANRGTSRPSVRGEDEVRLGSKTSFSYSQVEDDLLRLLIEDGDLAQKVKEEISLDEFEPGPQREILAYLYEKAPERVDPSSLFDRLESEETKTYLTRVLLVSPRFTHCEKAAVRDWIDSIRSHGMQLSAREVDQKLKEAEQRGDMATMKKLLARKTELVRASRNLVPTGQGIVLPD